MTQKLSAADGMSEKRGAGRPRHNPNEAKRVPLNMRTTPSLRTRLEDAAAESGRSLAQEVEARLEASFVSEDQLRERFGSGELQAVFQMLAGATRLIETRLGTDPLTDFRGFLALREAWQGLLKSVGPAPDEQLAKKIRQAAIESQAAEAAMPELPDAPPPIAAGLLSDDPSSKEREEHRAALKQYQDKLREYRAALERTSDAHLAEREVLKDLWRAAEVGRDIARQSLQQHEEQE
jgi:hypothetical protein